MEFTRAENAGHDYHDHEMMPVRRQTCNGKPLAVPEPDLNARADGKGEPIQGIKLRIPDQRRTTGSGTYWKR